MTQAPNFDVTVGMPVYDDPEGLQRTVPTVFSQTWPGRIRLLIIDDGSGPDTRAVIDSLASVYGGIEVIRNERNRGRPRARNQILENAGDGYLAWMDAGDLWHPRKLELQFAELAIAEEETPDQHVICVCPLHRYFLNLGTSKILVPEIQGDQLYNALMAKTLFAYLQAMLGPAEAFRRLGFDERLLRRQDYDLLVRFLAGGGRLVSTHPDLPLFTYLKSDVGANARAVARANRVIRAKHASLYRRYEPEVADQIRFNQHTLVARFHEANGQHRQAAVYRWLARAAGSDPLPSRARRRVVRLVRLFDPLRKALRRPVRKYAPPARRAIGFVRRGDVGRLATAIRRRIPILPGPDETEGTERRAPARPATSSPTAPASPSPAAAPATPSPTAPVTRSPSGGRNRTIDELEAIVAAEEPAEVDVWLELEQAYRHDGRLHSANEVLKRALGQHPGDHRLRARLVELLGLRREWEACVQEWRALHEENVAEDALTPSTYRRVARAFREIGQPSSAFEVASDGLRRWPRDKRLDDELHRSRALTLKWAAAMIATGTVPESDEDLGGVVTELGFLAGEAGPVEGDVRLGSGDAPRVAFLLNGHELAATFASPAPDGAPVGRFAINCGDVLHFLGDGDVLTIESEGAPILWPEGGTRLVVVPGHESRSRELFKRLKAGHVFMKFGQLSLGHTTESKRGILALYADIARLIEGEFGYTTYPFYGNLLGAIRDHDFIGHDVGGFDVAYVSGHDQPEQVRGEVTTIARLLAAHDYYVQLHPHSLYVRRSRSENHFVDVNFAWFNPNGELNMSYGWRYDPVTDRDGFFRPRQSAIFGELVPVPGNAEAVLEQLYGEHWAIPMQGFDPVAGIVRDDRYLMTRTELEALEAEEPDRIRVRTVLTPSGETLHVG
jgi:glycosyltransferase involved in cell wall biosynthesis